MYFILDILGLFGIFLILTISFNYYVGNTGVMFIGQIAFFAIGAYSSALFTHYFSLPPLIALFIGIIISVVFALGIGVLTIRLSGHYLLIASLGICEIVRSIANNSSFTNGATGMTVNNNLLGLNLNLGGLDVSIGILFFLLIEITFYLLLNNSPKGKLFNAVREDSFLLTAFGKSVNKLKLEGLIISAIWASIAGSLYAYYSRFVDPSSFTVVESLLLFIGIIIGGVGSIRGSIVAAAILIILPVLIRFINIPTSVISPIQQIIFAIVLITILILKPKGIFGKIYIK